MITRLTNEEYWLIGDAARRFPDNNALAAGIERLRNGNSQLDQVIKLRFEGDLELLVSFIIANSAIIYDVEVKEEKVIKVTYFRYLDKPVTKSDVEYIFRKASDFFHIYETSEEYSDFLDCSVNAIREMEPVEELRYDVVAQSRGSQDMLPIVEFDHQGLQSGLLASNANVRSWTTSSL